MKRILTCCFAIFLLFCMVSCADYDKGEEGNGSSRQEGNVHNNTNNGVGKMDDTSSSYFVGKMDVSNGYLQQGVVSQAKFLNGNIITLCIDSFISSENKIICLDIQLKDCQYSLNCYDTIIFMDGSVPYVGDMVFT